MSKQLKYSHRMIWHKRVRRYNTASYRYPDEIKRTQEIISGHNYARIKLDMNIEKSYKRSETKMTFCNDNWKKLRLLQVCTHPPCMYAL